MQSEKIHFFAQRAAAAEAETELRWSERIKCIENKRKK